MKENRKFVDIHHHLLCGIDDGPKQSQGMKNMLDAAYEEGIGTIIATPHATPGVEPFDMISYVKALAQANEYCAEKGYDIRIYGGSEIMYTPATVRLMQDKKIPTLAGTRFILAEWSDRTSVSAVTEAVRSMTNAGYIPVIAHVERMKCFHGRIDKLRQLKNSFDVRIQMNAQAILTRESLFSGKTVSKLLRNQLIDYVASDAHNVEMRKVQIKKAYSSLCLDYGKEYADALVYGNPMEIIQAIDENP